MMKNSRWKSFGIVLMCFVLCSFNSAGGAAQYPSYQENYINDFAGIIQPVDAQMLREKLQALEQQTGIEGTVVAVNSLEAYGAGSESIEAFATGLFNAWGVGNKGKNNGFLILLSVQDRKCRIELGDGYGSQYNGRMQDIVENTMVPRFKADEYSRGLYEGTLAVMEAVTKKVSWFEYYKWHLLGLAAIIFCVFAGISCIKNGKVGWGYAFFAAAGAILFWLVRLILSSKGSSGGFGKGSSSGRGGASGSW